MSVNPLTDYEITLAVETNKQLLEKVTALNEETARLSALVAEWRVLANGKVSHDNDGFHLRLEFSKTNGHNIASTVSEADCLRYVQDPDTLVEELMQTAYEHLLKENLRTVITPLVTRGLRNAVLMHERAK